MRYFQNISQTIIKLRNINEVFSKYFANYYKINYAILMRYFQNISKIIIKLRNIEEILSKYFANYYKITQY